MNKSAARGKARAALPSDKFALKDPDMTQKQRLFIARHGETVFNASKRLQGDAPHTPLTRAGMAQAEAMGAALAAQLGARPALTLHSSPAGRALQTLALVAEHVGGDWHATRVDSRLAEIDVGQWGGRGYAEVIAESGPIVDPVSGLFSQRAPGGEYYDDVAARLRGWIADIAALEGDQLIIMHGMSARVLRGLLLDLPVDPRWGAPVALNLPQGSMVMIEDRCEHIVHLGSGVGHA